MTVLTATKENFLVDSNILVYVHDLSSKEKQTAAARFFNANAGNPRFFLSIQNLAEFFFGITKRMGKSLFALEASECVDDFSKAATIIQYSPQTIVSAAGMVKNRQTHFWDALLAATMLENNIHLIYTENTDDFKKIPGIKAINPLKQKK